MANRKNSNEFSGLVINSKSKASPIRSKVLISPSKQLLYFFHKSDTFNLKSLQSKVSPKLRISCKKQQKTVNTQEMSFYQKYKREKSKSKDQSRKTRRNSQSLDSKTHQYQSLSNSNVDKTSDQYMHNLRHQIAQIRKKFNKNQQANKENKRLSTSNSCASGASFILSKNTTNIIKQPCTLAESTFASHPITPIKKIAFKNPMSSAFKNQRKQKLKIVYNPKGKLFDNSNNKFQRKQSRQTEAQEYDQHKLQSDLQSTKLFTFTFGNMALMDFPSSMINSVASRC